MKRGSFISPPTEGWPPKPDGVVLFTSLEGCPLCRGGLFGACAGVQSHAFVLRWAVVALHTSCFILLSLLCARATTAHRGY